MYLYGASGHGKVILEIAEDNGYAIEAFLDEDLAKNEWVDFPVVHHIPSQPITIVIAIGNNKVRKEIVGKNNTFNYVKLVHTRAIVSKSANVSDGTVIMAGVAVNSAVNIGKHCIINTNSSIDHDCEIRDFVHISPNVALAGTVEIGEGSHIGIGATVIQNIKIGKWVTIGAGAVVIADVPDYAVMVGNPGKIIKFNQTI